MNRAFAALLVTVLLTTAAFAQMAPPKPGPELKKLDYFVGNWASTGDMKAGPMGPGGSMTMQTDAKWMDGGFFVVMNNSYQSASMGNGTGISFLGYDPQEKVYTYYEFDSTGETVHANGTVDGDTWTWLSDMKMGPQTMKTRYIEKILSPTSYTFKFEMSADGTTWNTIMDGKATKK
ncbi:MAG TPA: DUF1579 family protein [Terriglobales bacterium]|nr:DUF1579 family protein [Terriglobales bacterium]